MTTDNRAEEILKGFQVYPFFVDIHIQLII